jgi:orotidine-5'-phosphate decarboxylase
LIPGVGAQGGDLELSVRSGVDAHNRGIMINSSRGILYAGKGPDFANAARRAAQTLRDEINKVIEGMKK